MIAYINGTNGDPIWIMGGKRNQFTDRTTGKAPDFALQHSPTFNDRDLTDLRMFDNHIRNMSYGCTANCSTGRFFTVNDTTMSVSSVRRLSYPNGLQSMALGNVEPSQGGNAFVNWGFNPAFTEHSPDGVVVFDVQFGVLGGKAIGTYRAYKRNWTGYPTTNPSIVVRRQNSSSQETLYVSWNGATEVKRWILVSSSPSAGDPIMTGLRFCSWPRLQSTRSLELLSSTRSQEQGSKQPLWWTPRRDTSVLWPWTPRGRSLACLISGIERKMPLCEWRASGSSTNITALADYFNREIVSSGAGGKLRYGGVH